MRGDVTALTSVNFFEPSLHFREAAHRDAVVELRPLPAWSQCPIMVRRYVAEMLVVSGGQGLKGLQQH
jgi:hypothetical protein